MPKWGETGTVTPAGTPPLRVGTRGSALATTQTGHVARRLEELTGRDVEIVRIRTDGDVLTGSLAQMGGTGVFVTALREALLDGRCDVAVHSLKDLPTKPDPRITLAALPVRHDHRDALVGPTKFFDLPAGARVGTGSPRRVAMLSALRPDLEYVPIRGNAETRLGKVSSGELDAVVLAYAGLDRVGRLDDVTDVFEVEQVLPAPGQGALAVECRTADAEGALSYLSAVDHTPTRAAVTAERVILAELEAGCAAPVGAYAEFVADDRLRLRAAVVATDGSQAVRAERTVAVTEFPDAVQAAAALGHQLAHEMIRQGADQIVGDAAAGRGEI